MSPHVLLIDGYNLIRRIFEARPRQETEEHLQETVESAVHSLQRALGRHQPSHACCVLEAHDTTWRHLLYKGYKEDRKPTPAPLLNGLARFEASFSVVGVPCVSVQSYEADDVIATLALGITDNGGSVVILSTDRMYLQLLRDGVSVFDHFGDRFLTTEHVREKFGVRPDQLIDYWALSGAATNHIKGVPKIGPKSALQLLDRFGDLDGVLNAEPSDKLIARVQQYRRDAEVSRQLVMLKTDVEVGVNLRSLRYVPDAAPQESNL